MNDCYEAIFAMVRGIPSGKVMTYGQIAGLLAAYCTSAVPAVQVGRALAASTRYAPDLPWWRVIGRNGNDGVLRKLSLSSLQKELLAREGILPDAEGRYDLERYLHQPVIDDEVETP